MPYLWIAIGSALGGMARYWCAVWSASHMGELFPWGTLIVNVAGSFVIGFFGILTGPDGRLPVGAEGRLFVMVGFCGGFTTFSAFSLETGTLLERSPALAASYVIASVGLGLAAFALAWWMVRR